MHATSGHDTLLAMVVSLRQRLTRHSVLAEKVHYLQGIALACLNLKTYSERHLQWERERGVVKMVGILHSSYSSGDPLSIANSTRYLYIGLTSVRLVQPSHIESRIQDRSPGFCRSVA